MKRTHFYKITGVFLILNVLAALIGEISLGINFDWEGHSVSEILTMYHNGGSIIILTWIVFALGSFFLIPTALLLHKVFVNKKTPFLYIGTTFGVIAGISYIIGIARWILLANIFSGMYADPLVTENTKHIMEVVFQAINVYAGNTFGETVAPIAHAIWLIFLGAAMFKSKIAWRWMALVQIIAGIIIACRPLEYAGLKTLASMSDQGLMLWALIMAILGITLLFKADDRDIDEIERVMEL